MAGFWYFCILFTPIMFSICYRHYLKNVGTPSKKGYNSYSKSDKRFKSGQKIITTTYTKSEEQYAIELDKHTQNKSKHQKIFIVLLSFALLFFGGCIKGIITLNEEGKKQGEIRKKELDKQNEIERKEKQTRDSLTKILYKIRE